MSEDKSGGKWSKVIIIAVIIIIVIGVLIGLLVGLQSLKTFFIWFLAIILVACIGFGLIYLFWLIFIKKEYKDIPANYKKKLIQTALLMKNDMLGDLYLSGDVKHNRIKLGRFRYMRIMLPKAVTQVKELTSASEGFNPLKKTKEILKTQPVPIDCFVIMKNTLMEKLFGNPIFILVKPQDHNFSSIFNDVTLNAFNLVPLDSQFFTIDKRNLDVDIIKSLSTNYIREVVYEIFRDLDRLVKQSINLDQQHLKNKEKGMEFQIPSFQSGDENDRR